MERLLPGSADVTQPTDVIGGLFWLGESGTWTKVFPGGTGQPGATYMDFRSLEQSADGAMLYAGTRGRSVGDGLVMRCSATQATSGSAWTALSNGLTFGFAVPYYRVGWDLSYAGYEFTEVWALAVDPTDHDVVYAGLHSQGAFPAEGVWRCDASTLSWSQQPPGAPKKGMGVLDLAVDPTDSSRLMVGTQGQELHIFDVSGN